MKFLTLLKSNKLQGWEDFYIRYDLLIKYLKTDVNMFKRLMTSEFKKITTFYNDIEEQTEEQKNGLLAFIKNNLKDDTSNVLNSKENLKNQELINIINKAIDRIDKPKDAGSTLSELNDNLNSEGSLSYGGEESDYENVNVVQKIKKEEYDTMETKHKKKMFFGFESFKINKQFENRKKEKAFHEILQAINSVKSYRDINIMGMSIAIRKYKNRKGSDEFSSDFLKKLHQSHLSRSRRIDIMQKDVKRIYKKVFKLDDNSQVLSIFKRIGKKYKMDPWLSFLVGVSLSFLAFVFTNIDFSTCPSTRSVAYSIGFIHLGFFLFGLCDILFHKYNINSDLIFNFDVISGLSSLHMILYVTLFLNVNYLLCYFLVESYSKCLKYLLIGMNTAVIFLPLDYFWYKSRLYFISVFFGTLVSGFKKVYFKNFFFADVFQSYTPCFGALIFETCLDKSMFRLIVLNVLFPTIRIIQCINRYKETGAAFPHILNMTKYWFVFLANVVCIGFTDKTHGRIKALKLFLCMCASLYSLAWDFLLDWTIFRKKKSFPWYFYHVSFVYNTMARQTWLLKEMKIVNDEWAIISIEIIRRFVWALLRVENEHVNNCTDDKSKLGILFSKELFFVKDDNKRVNVDTDEMV